MKSALNNKRYKFYKAGSETFTLQPYETMEDLAWKIIRTYIMVDPQDISYRMYHNGLKMKIAVWDIKEIFEYFIELK